VTARFFDYWRERVEFVASLPLPARHHEANVLAFAALDSLANLWARAVARTGGPAARRFGEFLITHGGRGDVFERVSLPYMRWRATEKSSGFPTATLHLLRTCGAATAPPGPYTEEARRLRSLSDDPTIAALLTGPLASVAMAVDAKSGRSLADWLLDARLGEIAYVEYRCSWLHEGRAGEATHSFDFGDTEPTYLSNDYTIPPRIRFPLPFVVTLLRNCIDGFQREVGASGVDPAPPPHMPAMDIDDLEAESRD